MEREMWAEKCRPHTVAEVIGNDEAKIALFTWLRKWRPKSKAALLHGPAGTGKTSLVHAIAEEFRYQLIEMNASDIRTEEALTRLAEPTVREDSLDRILYGARGNLLFLDEIDGIFGREDRGGVRTITKIISEAQSPVILAANDIQDQRLRSIVRACQSIRFYRVRIPIMMMSLRRICRLEGVDADEEALRAIAAKSDGDIRSAINDLQMLVQDEKRLKASDIEQLTSRDRQIGVSDTLNAIFSAETMSEAWRAEHNSQLDPETLLQAVHDNLPLRFTDPTRLAKAYDAVSKADVFFGRIRRTQNWGLLPYAMENMMRGLIFPAERRASRLNYRFPPWKWIILSRTKAVRALREEICRKIGVRCHVSRRAAGNEYIPYLRTIFQSDSQAAAEIASWLQLEENEVHFLSGDSTSKMESDDEDQE